jgi:hypothetical protein
MYILSRLSPLMLCLNSSGFLRQETFGFTLFFHLRSHVTLQTAIPYPHVGHGHVFIATTLIASVPVAYPC